MIKLLIMPKIKAEMAVLLVRRPTIAPLHPKSDKMWQNSLTKTGIFGKRNAL